MAYGLKTYEIVYGNKAGGDYMASTQRYVVKASGDASGIRQRGICPGMLVVYDATDSAVDGCRGTNDTLFGGADQRAIVGLVKNVLDTAGKAKRVPYLATTEGGLVEVWPVDGITLRAVEDATGGAMTGSGSCGQADGTIISTSADDGVLGTNNPLPCDKLDSSTRHASATQHALQIVELDPRDDNTGTAKVYHVKVNPAYIH